jgi:dolichol-phosphate mannosyltransferase
VKAETSNPTHPEISVVIPFYNEAECAGPQIEELHPVLLALARPFEIVAVDDGSTDRTLEILRGGKAAHPELRVVHLAANSGQSAATAAGFAAARGALVFVMDGDLQADPADIPPMLARLEQGDCDAVCGWRRERRDGWLRRASGRIANAARNLVTGDRVADTGCPLKLFRAEFLRRIPAFKGMHRFLPALVRMEGARVAEMPVRHRPRPAGRSKYGVWNRAWVGSADLLGVRWLKSRHIDCRSEEVW